MIFVKPRLSPIVLALFQSWPILSYLPDLFLCVCIYDMYIRATTLVTLVVWRRPNEHYAGLILFFDVLLLESR